MQASKIVPDENEVSQQLSSTRCRGAIADASYHQQQHNPGVTEIVQMKNRGHALTIDSGWGEVAQTALAFVQRFVQP